MAHELRTTDGLALFQNAAWHGLGNVIQEDMNPEQALVAANLDWTAAFGKSQAAVMAEGTSVPITESRTLFRLPRPGHTYTDGTPERHVELGTHGLQYTPLQNKDLFQTAYALGEQVKVESAGSLFDGRKVFCLLRGETLNLKHDEVVPYLGLFNGHDGSISFSAMPTGVRIVCNNTLNLALKTGASKMFRVKHTPNIGAQIKEMEKALLRFQETGKLFQEKVEALQAKKIKDEATLIAFWTKAYLELNGEEELDQTHLDESTQTLDAWRTTLEMERVTMGYPDVDMWIAANAVTRFVQHSNPERRRQGWQERQVQSNWIGANQDKTVDIFKIALAY